VDDFEFIHINYGFDQSGKELPGVTNRYLLFSSERFFRTRSWFKSSDEIVGISSLCIGGDQPVHPQALVLTVSTVRQDERWRSFCLHLVAAQGTVDAYLKGSLTLLIAPGSSSELASIHQEVDILGDRSLCKH
jgi:hypothetical protein